MLIEGFQVNGGQPPGEYLTRFIYQFQSGF